MESIGLAPWTAAVHTTVASLHGMNGARFKTNFDSFFFISARDTLTMLCDVKNSSYGTYGIHNHNTGLLGQERFAAVPADTLLVGQHAEGIVDDFQTGAKLISLPLRTLERSSGLSVRLLLHRFETLMRRVLCFILKMGRLWLFKRTQSFGSQRRSLVRL